MGPRKLVDDCFRTDSERMRHSDAIALLRSRVSPITAPETVPLAEASGRVIAAPILSPRPVPAFTNAAVDGYAFAHRDATQAATEGLPIFGRVAAGHALQSVAPTGRAVRIFTGAPLPDVADTVAMQEDCTLSDDGGRVIIPSGLKPGANVRKAGEDVAQGAPLFERGSTIRPQDIAALASIGLTEVPAFARLRLAVLSSGDEVVRPGTPLDYGQVYDANAPMISALARSAGCMVTDLGIAADRTADIERLLAEAAGRFDVIVTSGGASRGEEDHMVAALERLGSRHMWQLAIKPGRPMAFGQIGDTVVLGLPGNPVAVFVCFLLYAWPVLRALGGAGWSEPQRLQLPANFTFAGRKTGRREYWRGRIITTASGLAVEKFARDGSGLISGLRWSEGLIEVPEDAGDVHPGQSLDFIPFSEYGIIG